MTKIVQAVRWTVAAAGTTMLGAAVAGNAGAGRQARSSDASSIEHNKAAALRWSRELWSEGNLAVADEIIAPDYQRHDPGDPFPARGPEDVKRIVTMLRTMLPDLRIRVEAVIAEGDFVVSRYTATATDTAGYMGLPPTGRALSTPAIQIFRFATGKPSRAGPRGTTWARCGSWDISRCPAVPAGVKTSWRRTR